MNLVNKSKVHNLRNRMEIKDEQIQKLKENNSAKNDKIQKQKEKIEKQSNKISRQKEKIDDLETQLKMIMNSRSYRIGQMITWLPRKIASLIKGKQ